MAQTSRQITAWKLKLRNLSSCDCSDALLKLGVRHGGFLVGPTMWSPKRQEGDTLVVGPAYTVQYAPLDDPTPKLSHHYIDRVPHGSVIFISSPLDIPNAVYGGLMSARAKASGAAGTIVDGRIRDLNEHRDLRMPVFARDVSSTAPYELVKVIATDVPIRVKSDKERQDVTVNPGDFVVADLDGVVIIPPDLIDQVAEIAARQKSADVKVQQAILKGMTFTEASNRFRS